MVPFNLADLVVWQQQMPRLQEGVWSERLSKQLGEFLLHVTLFVQMFDGFWKLYLPHKEKVLIMQENREQSAGP